jgi:ABC-type nitrate/sulfonate/bicarbonate transport system substrate-binding protein
VKSFLAGARHGWLWAYDNRDSALDILAPRMARPDKTILRKKLDSTFSFIMHGQDVYRGVFPMNADDWQRTFVIMRDFGNLKQPIDIDDSFSNQFNVE